MKPLAVKQRVEQRFIFRGVDCIKPKGFAAEFQIYELVGAKASGRVAVARKDEVKAVRATNWHDGQITKSLSSPLRKNISVAASGKSEV
jgi:hypothetical protein